MIDELVRASIAKRESLLSDLGEQTDCYRLFHGVTEGRPGLAIDRYGPILLLQTWREPLSQQDIDSCRVVAERALGDSLVAVWNHRGKGRKEPFSRFHDPAVAEDIVGRELSLRYDVRPRHRGLDPLLFLDSRVLRRHLRNVASGRSVLNLFAYTCSAGISAVQGGAREVWNVDFSGSALRTGARNAELNALAPDAMENIQEDVLPVVRQLAGLPIRLRRGRNDSFRLFEPKRFDIVVLDPPRWSKGAFGAVDLVRDYPGIFKPALMASSPGGWVLATNNVPEVALADWRRMLERTGEKCGRPVRSIEILEPEADFPSFDGAPPLKIAWVQTE